MGRRRTKNLNLPAGVTEKSGTWYWQPTSKRERDERRRNRSLTGEPVGCRLGPAGSKEARKKWAEVSGYGEIDEAAGTVAELLRIWQRDGLKKQPNGAPRAESTIEMYGASIQVLIARFGAARYGRTEHEASRGLAIGTVDVQDFVSESKHPAMANRHFAVLDNAFSHAIRIGKTTYNPCAEVVKNAGGVREREALPWEVECLRALASPRLGLQMDYEAITGWRVSDILNLVRAQGTADGVRVRYKKRGRRWLWEWTTELRRIWREAEELPYATKFPASPVFPSRRRGCLSYEAFDGDWQALKRTVNALLAGGIVDPDTLEVRAGLKIEDLHFHDLRSKAYDDAEDLGRVGHDVLGNSEHVARRHYARRERKVRPLK